MTPYWRAPSESIAHKLQKKGAWYGTRNREIAKSGSPALLLVYYSIALLVLGPLVC